MVMIGSDRLIGGGARTYWCHQSPTIMSVSGLYRADDLCLYMLSKKWHVYTLTEQLLTLMSTSTTFIISALHFKD